jgi:hypothetical protein
VAPDFGAAVVQLVAINAGDDDVLEIHQPDGVADSVGLIEVE